MKRDIARLMGTWLDGPLMCTSRYANIAAAAFAGKLDIRSVQSEFGKMEREDLEALAQSARADADIRADAKRATRKWRETLATCENIAVIEVWGALTRTWGVGPYSGATGYDGILMQLEDALQDPAIKGIWLDIDSGGGTVNGLMGLVDQIFLARSRNKDAINDKPIWAMAADYAYSAAFAIGTAADRFYVPPTGGVGSVGTITMHTSYKRQLEEEGIDVTVLRYPELKFRGTEFELLDDDTRQHIMGQLKELTEIFQDKVARNMGIAKSAVAATKGLDYMGRHAKAIGFVSDVLPEAIVWEKFKRLVSKR